MLLQTVFLILEFHYFEVKGPAEALVIFPSKEEFQILQWFTVYSGAEVVGFSSSALGPFQDFT